MERTFTAHIELQDGSYSSFKVDAKSFADAYEQAKEQIDPGETLSGVTEG